MNDKLRKLGLWLGRRLGLEEGNGEVSVGVEGGVWVVWVVGMSWWRGLMAREGLMGERCSFRYEVE